MANEFERAVTEPPESISQVLEGLNDLLQLDHDSVGAYEIAQEHLANPEHIARIRSFQEDHQRHIQDLNDLILNLGGIPVNEPHTTSLLKEGIQRLSASGGDRAILTAWRANELAAARKYGQYAKRSAAWPEQATALVGRHAADEDRHYAWVREVLGEDGTSMVDAESLRDRFAGWGEAISKEIRSGEVRDRAVDALSSAAERIDRLVAGGSPGGFREKAAGSAHAAARGLNSAAEGIRNMESFDPRTRLADEVRHSPARTLAAVFAVGFVLGRLVR